MITLLSLLYVCGAEASKTISVKVPGDTFTNCIAHFDPVLSNVNSYKVSVVGSDQFGEKEIWMNRAATQNAGSSAGIQHDLKKELFYVSKAMIAKKVCPNSKEFWHTILENAF